MRFVPLASAAPAPLDGEYRAARQIGRLRLGEQWLFVRAGGRVHYLAYGELRRYFRRVIQVPARLCCGRGNFEVENLVLCTAAGEAAQVELPGRRAALLAMEELARLAPDATAGRP